MNYDKIIIGAGLYGLFSALLCARKGEQVLVLEYDDGPFKRASFINQARVHMGYHYPRSYSTAIKSANYFDRFVKDFKDCINSQFHKIYAISSSFSWTNAEQFEKFCYNAGILCDMISPNKYFNDGLCEGAFITREYAYDAEILLKILMSSISRFSDKIKIQYNTRIRNINLKPTHYMIDLENGEQHSTDFLVNTTYASVNQILKKLDYTPFAIKYEICEMILCNVSDYLSNLGITVMDGPFFSIMPFGKTRFHSLTSVTFTPHTTSYESLPVFDCQEESNGYCSPGQLGNCSQCTAKPRTAWDFMSHLAKKYIKPEYEFKYDHSLFSIKPILKASEIDDSRPTIIRQYSENPTFISVLSGKINTIYDLEEVL